jgi:hypothetical protein
LPGALLNQSLEFGHGRKLALFELLVDPSRLIQVKVGLRFTH